MMGLVAKYTGKSVQPKNVVKEYVNEAEKMTHEEFYESFSGSDYNGAGKL